ncbi:MAG TPA: flagellar hook protein FlgE [Polyangia bacterium]|jgi:flagellar hook protein FlgE|nr:flagellar hook protein FlgE [Polyangia bacterium]HWE31227.1 flagellar hook protein FlgE [Polyangia bacterium]
MSIFTTLYTGASGLEAHGDAISVVGDDISNASTVGYKDEEAQFANVIGGATLAGQNVGDGVRMSGTQTEFGQGSLETTGRNLDVAISGNGFFVVNGNYNGQQGSYYTRDGSFSLNDSGTLVNEEGMAVQGYTIDPTGKMSTTPSDLVIGGASPPNATTEVTMGINLDSTSTTPTTPWDPANPAATSNYSTSTEVYDSLGDPHRVDVYYVDNGGGQWDYHAMVDGGDVTGGTAGVPTEIASGNMTFNTDGSLQTVNALTSSANFLNATPNQAITFNMGDPISAGGTGLAGTTQYASASTVNAVNQDGYAAGSLSNVTIGDDGTVTGTFSNGESRSIARLAMATFASQDNLQREGDQLFSQSQTSGQALVDAAGVGGRGSTTSGALEQSNVDLSSELVTLIAYQRAFSANSKTVQTADQMLQEVDNLKQT